MCETDIEKGQLIREGAYYEFEAIGGLIRAFTVLLFRAVLGILYVWGTHRWSKIPRWSKVAIQ